MKTVKICFLLFAVHLLVFPISLVGLSYHIMDIDGYEISYTELCPEIIVTGTIYHVSCHGVFDGFVYTSVSGGTPPYTYFWPEENETYQNLWMVTVGTYTVIVTDANGCQGQATFEVGITPPQTISGNISVVTCNGADDGAINLSVSGGDAPYYFSWSNGATTEDIESLAPGTYSVIVHDQEGCEATGSYEVSEPDPLTIIYETTIETCAGCSDGTTHITVSGGTAPFTYLWSNGATTEDINSLTADSYTVTVTDQNGCTEEITINVFNLLLMFGNGHGNGYGNSIISRYEKAMKKIDKGQYKSANTILNALIKHVNRLKEWGKLPEEQANAIINTINTIISEIQPLKKSAEIEPGIDDREAPEVSSLGPIYPNPFKYTTTIAYAVSTDGSNPEHVRIFVYNSTGQVVAKLVDQKMASGSYSVEWDGRYQDESMVSNGIYYIRFASSNVQLVEKTIVIR